MFSAQRVLSWLKARPNGCGASRYQDMRKGLYISLLTALFLLAALFLHQVRQDRVEQYLQHSTDLLQATYDASLERYALAMETFYTNLARQPALFQLFYRGTQADDYSERAQLREVLYQQLQPHYQDLRARGINQWQFHQADGTSFLRFHAPDVHDDELASVRPSLRQLQDNPQNCYGFEVGRFFIGFRFIHPLLLDKQMIGSMETAVSFSRIRQTLARLSPHQTFIFLLERSTVESVLLGGNHAQLQPALISPDFLIHTDSLNDALNQALPLENLRHALAAKPQIQQQLLAGEPFAVDLYHQATGYAAAFIPVQTLTGELGGYILSIHPAPLLTGLQWEFYTMVVISLLVTLMLGWLMLHLHQQRHAILSQKYRLDAISAAVGEGIYVLDTEGQTLYVNKAVCRLTGYNEHKLYRENLHQLLHQHEANEHLTQEQCPIFSQALKGITYEGDEQFKTRTGELLPVVVTSQPMIEHGRITGVVTVFRDIRERKETERTLKRLATTDSLTGLSNRRAFLERLQEEQRLSRRLGHPSSLLMVDFDHFKRINDEYGHPIGDMVLQHFASMARSCLRETDAIGRLGGEEFAILLPGTDLKGAVQLAERLRHLLEQTPTQTPSGPIPMTLSIGVTPLLPEDSASSELLSRADDALYQAKESGRNRIKTRE